MKCNNIIRFLALIIGVFSIIVVGTYIYYDQKISYSVIDADYINFSSLQELITDSDLIITDHPLSSQNYLTKTPEGYTDEAYTITDFQIDNIKKKSLIIDVVDGQTIKVIEPTYLYDKVIKPGKIKFSIDGYQQMKQDSKYILFLKINRTGDKFLINGIIQGKYNIDGKDNLEDSYFKNKDKFKNFKHELKSLYRIK